MAETADYNPGDWKGYDFDAARKTYDVHVNRSYTNAVADKKRVADLVPASISTESPEPLVILCDVTGSMGDWPATIFSKLPYLDLEAKEYLGPDMEISFAAVGDANTDSYPIQIRPFKKGKDLEVQLKELVVEGGGGGQNRESYELTALYYARNAEMPNAKRPIMIIIGDEDFYPFIRKDICKMAHVNIEDTELDTKEVFEELTEKYSVYLVRKPYTYDDKKIEKNWADLIGQERIATLPSADRIVDVIFGILAKEKNKISYFKKEIEDRQRKDQVDTVYKSLETIHAALPKAGTKGKSVLHSAVTGKATKRLLP